MASALVAALVLLTACTQRDVTKAEIRQLRPYMTYEQTVALIGSEGHVVHPGEEVVGSLVPTSDHETIYLWKNADGSMLSAAFQDRYLVSWNEYNF